MKKVKMLLNCKGLTLVEVIVSLAIITIVASFLVVTFGSSFALIRRGADMESFGDRAFAEAEASSDASYDDNLSFFAGGRTYNIKGAYNEYTYSESGEVSVKFMVFDTE